MIVPDVNMLLYAYDAESAFHEKARNWWQERLSGAEQVGLAEAVIFGFLRVGTSARVFRNPMTSAEAARHVRAWLQQPIVQILGGGHEQVERVLAMIEEIGTAGNLVTDAQIAALALEYGAIVHTSDADFIRFADLKWFNPLTGKGSRGLTKGR